MNENLKKILTNTGLILIIIVISALLVRHFSGSETLSEYAEKNPSVENSETKTESVADGNDTFDEITGNPSNTDFTDNNTEKDADTEEIIPENRVTYKDGFYYEPLSQEVIDQITGCSYPILEEGEVIEVSYEDLSYVVVQYVGFDYETHEGEIICNNAIAQDLVEIFYELYRNEYQIESIALIEEYDGDDLASCTANNTSCFNYREVVGSSSLSKHALGLAIDINPLYNPYITYNSDGSENVYPENATDYADRSKSFPYKIDENDLCYKLFIEHGFTWGGHWNSVKDYQHFQRVIN